MTIWNTFIWNLCKFIKKKKEREKNPMYIRIHSLCHDTQNWVQVHPVSTDHPWDVSTTWLESTCNSAFQSTNQDMKSKELSVDLRDRIVSRHRSGEGYRKTVLKVPMSIIHKWKSLEPPGLFMMSGQTEQSGRRALVREVTKSLMVTLTELLHFSVERGEPSRRATISVAVH